jgi:menaquinol-cytochrome c reductase iron-sulfur subunit
MTTPMDGSPLGVVPPPRRNFLLELAAGALGGVAALGPLIAGGLFAVDPLLRRKPSMAGGDAEGFLPVVDVAALPQDGTPERFALHADLLDAWNRFAGRTIGNVYLRKVGENVIAFTDVCPHLGCKVEYKGGERPQFFCPCHQGSFALDGQPLNQIPPRAMDDLQVKVVAGKVWVKYQQFQTGRAEKAPVT